MNLVFSFGIKFDPNKKKKKQKLNKKEIMKNVFILD